MDFTEETTKTKVPHLQGKVTTHRMVLFHPTNTVYNFEWHFSQIKKYDIEKRGWFSKYAYKIVLHMNNGFTYKVKRMDRDNFEDFIKHFEDVYKSGSWKHKEHKVEQPNMTTSNYSKDHRSIFNPY